MERIFDMIDGCRTDNPKHQKKLYEQYYGLALKIVFRYIYQYEEAVEVTNDGFVKFFSSIEKFRCGTETDASKMLIGWIKRIMVNTAIDLLRKKMLLPQIGGIPDQVWQIQDDAASADKMLIYKDLIIQVKKLPPSLRIVFNMHVIDGYSHIEIAELLNIPVGTSKSNLLRARLLLKKYLDQKETLTECSI